MKSAVDGICSDFANSKQSYLEAHREIYKVCITEAENLMRGRKNDRGWCASAARFAVNFLVLLLTVAYDVKRQEVRGKVSSVIMISKLRKSIKYDTADKAHTYWAKKYAQIANEVGKAYPSRDRSDRNNTRSQHFQKNGKRKAKGKKKPEDK